MGDMKAMVDLPRMSALLTYPTSNRREPNKYACIRLEDEDSGQIIAEIELNPDQLFALMANSHAYGSGQVNRRSERFGKHREHHTVRLDRKEWGLDYNSTADHPAIRAHLTELGREWEIVRHAVKHGQHYIECIRWVERGGDDAVEPAADDRGADGA